MIVYNVFLSNDTLNEIFFLSNDTLN